MKIPQTPIKRARIEIIPMIDTIFFLLVFFMIASLTMIRMRAIAVALPKGATPIRTSQSGGASTDLILTMTDRGDYFLGKQKVGRDTSTLEQMLGNRLANNPPKDIVLNFNKLRSTQEMIEVMDIIGRSKSAAGRDTPVLIATSPVDQEGHAISDSHSTSLLEDGGK